MLDQWVCLPIPVPVVFTCISLPPWQRPHMGPETTGICSPTVLETRCPIQGIGRTGSSLARLLSWLQGGWHQRLLARSHTALVSAPISTQSTSLGVSVSKSHSYSTYRDTNPRGAESPCASMTHLNLITSAKTPFPNKVILTAAGLGIEHIFFAGAQFTPLACHYEISEQSPPV